MSNKNRRDTMVETEVTNVNEAIATENVESASIVEAEKSENVVVKAGKAAKSGISKVWDAIPKPAKVVGGVILGGLAVAGVYLLKCAISGDDQDNNTDCDNAETTGDETYVETSAVEPVEPTESVNDVYDNVNVNDVVE